MTRGRHKPAPVMGMGNTIGVVHLVRAQNGSEPFRRFLESYRENPGGIDHELVIVYKGFTAERSVSEYEELLTGIDHQRLFVRDIGFDIRPYFLCARRFTYDYFCFLNSFSVILDLEWLEKLYRYASQSDVGMVGATGSWESMYSDFLAWVTTQKGVPLVKRLLIALQMRRLSCYFCPFPNYHVRTNAFMISRENMNRVTVRTPLSKMAAHRLESGRNSISKQMHSAGKRLLIVGRDGHAYEKEQWATSGTFWQGDQSNLLVADNQTNRYAHADPLLRGKLRKLSWGMETPGQINQELHE